MKVYALLLMIAVNLFANSSDTKLILEMMKENNKNIIRVIQENNKNLENQIKAVKVDLENQIKAVKVDLENQIKATNKRIDDVNNRIDDVNNRINTLSGYIIAMFSGLMAFVGFIYWDRRTMIAKAKDEVKNEMSSVYVQRDSFNEVVETLKDLATISQDIAKVVNRHNLKAV